MRWNHNFSSALKLSQAGVLAVALTAVVGSSLAYGAPTREPLLMEGKSTLYQRVLSTPGCKLHTQPNGSDAGRELPAFSQYYVYSDTGTSYEVGPNATGTISGYLNKDCVVPWKMQLALLFTNSANRNRSLIFDDQSALDNIIDSEEGPALYRKLQAKVAAGKHAEHVISIEPEEYVDYQKNFYLLPILQSVETMYPDGAFVYKHEIASITSKEAQNASDAVANQGSDKSAASSKDNAQFSVSPSGAIANNASSAQVSNQGDIATGDKGTPGGDPSIVGFKSAVVFVIDSSISMRPYIERTKKAINSIYKSIEASNLNDSVHFGIVSFRADTRHVPGLEYTAKMYLRPGEAKNAQEFNKSVASLDQAKVSSSQFDEDAYAGINLALQDINWNDYGGRYLVLITDAGAIDADDKQSSTGLDANALRMEAEHFGAAIYTLHLLTKSGKSNHKHAQEQYETLSFNQVLNKPLYYPVNAGSVESFGTMVDTLSKSLTNQVQLATQGMLSAGSALAAQDHEITIAPETPKEPEAALVEDSRKLGLAMQLAYLGRLKGTQSPEFLQGWMTDRDVEDHNKLTCTPIVLVNRNQLSDLYTLVKGVLQSGIAGQLSSDDMFGQLKALAAQMGRDPNQLSKSKSISDMGIMGELLDDLPYKSLIGNITPEDWYNLGSQEQERIVRALENSLNYIQHCAGDNDRFIKLNEEADSSEEVYPIPLDALP